MVAWDTFVPLDSNRINLIEFDDNAEMRIPLSCKAQMALDPRLPEFKVLFGDFYWKIECDFVGIELIYEFVTNSVIPRFTRFFK
jgi:hypothetical protein